MGETEAKPAAAAAGPRVVLAKTLADLTTSALRTFVDAHAEVPCLIVALDDPSGELETGLTACGSKPRVENPALKPLGFDTNQVSAAHLKRQAAQMQSEREAVGHGLIQLRRRLVRGRHFAIPLAKREGANDAFASRVSIGRAPNVDVVLRHISVSKFHAYFERREDGVLCVADADTTNGTCVNDLKATPRQPVPVSPGDVLRFGVIETMLCDAEALWQALRTR